MDWNRSIQTPTAGPVSDFELADSCHPLGELLLQRHRGDSTFNFRISAKFHSFSGQCLWRFGLPAI